MVNKDVNKMLDEFFEKLKDMGASLTKEELNTAIDSLKEFTSAMSRAEAGRQRESENDKNDEKDNKTENVEADSESYEDSLIMLDMNWDGTALTEDEESEKADNTGDAYIMCLNRFGRIDLDYMSRITGLSAEEIIVQLKGAIYQNPDTWGEDPLAGWETADQYLSGNVLHKWRRARTARRIYGDRFNDNVTALNRIMPSPVAGDDIYVTLGSPWIPSHIIDEFIYHLVGDNVPKRLPESYRINHVQELGLWEVPAKNRFDFTRYSVKANSVYGTSRIGMLHILEKTLNMKTIEIHDTLPTKSAKKGEKRVLNESETVLAIEKQDKIIKEFQRWVFTDGKRKEELYKIYESRFGSVIKRRFDGSFLRLPGLNPGIKLYKYQMDAVARIISTPTTLLAHDVGSGKTYTMIVAGMEMKRMKISEKNMYVVPNNLTGQWCAMFKLLYPKSRILCIEPKTFKPNARAEALERIKVGDYDAVVIAYSCFDLIPLSFKYYVKAFEELENTLTEIRDRVITKSAIDKRLKKVYSDFRKLKDKVALNGSVGFDELGINTLFIDEAHNFKNVPVDTKISRVLGISNTGSAKCKEMMEKVLCVQRDNGGRGVVFATGTPITNSVTDVFVMQKYLQSGELSILDLQSFDSWVGMFAERNTEFEIDVDTGSYRLATRFSRFHNLPELTNILASVADFHVVDKENGIPELKGYNDSLIGASLDFSDYLKKISARADRVRSGGVSRTEDNLLKITTDGRKAALDMRLVDDKASFTYQSKVATCAENVYDIYVKGKEKRLTQLVFCDISTPKKEFNIYDELSRLLCDMGVKREEIAYVHDATTEKKRNDLFSAMQRGDIRILIGSTFKLGLGVNVQNKLIAIHHIDVPWRPADMVQREGRILRQGNENERVFIYRYITEGSFDAYSWQLLETKQRFISELLSGSLAERSGGDIDSTVLNYAEVKALAIGNPLIKKRVETANELNRYSILHLEAVEERDRLKRELADIPSKRDRVRALISTCSNDLKYYKENKTDYDKEQNKEIREKMDAAIKANIGNPRETEILTYQGFKVSVPAYLSEDKPCVYLEREGRYLVELGKELGMTRRLDFFLDSLEKQREKYKEAIIKYNNREKAIIKELAGETGYASHIEELRSTLAKIDKELGVI